MKKLLLFLFTLINLSSYAQIDISISIDSGTSTSTCTDPVGTPELVWSVNIDNNGEVHYPETGICFTALPNIQHTATYTCPVEVPATINICYKAFENDHLAANLCQIDESCSEEICADFAIPALNTSANYTLSLPANLASGGEVNFTITNSAASLLIDNDLLCNAVDFGVLPFNGNLGDANQGLYQNFCATNLNEPSPLVDGFFSNNAGVWFTFTTGADPSGEILIHTLSDPQNIGAPLEIEVASYISSTNDCTGVLSIVAATFVNSNHDDNWFSIVCPEANTAYFILIDGVLSSRGVFGIEVMDVGVVDGGDFRCDFEELGVVPAGGSVETADWVSNFCATNSDDPFISAFISQNSVWFSFTAPPSGHVLIEGITDIITDSIGVQLALYRSFNNTCSGPFGHVMSQYDAGTLDQEMEATCLFPGKPYWILVDGTGFNARGIFRLKVTDAGDITPKITIDTILCAGESINIGFSAYGTTGSYADTIPIFAGCDSIVFSNITVSPPLTITITQTPAINQTATGIAMTTVSGGNGGPYTYQWCNGETTPTASSLVGDSNCCVTITDTHGCELIECFDVAFISGILPVFENDTLLCFGDTNGDIRFSALSGESPYNYIWEQSISGLSGNGIINIEGEEISIPNLPAGEVSITISDNFFDTTFIAEVVQPLALVVDDVITESASCFGICDGSLDVNISGGVGAYNFLWSNTEVTEDISGLCSGEYTLTISDENSCETIALFNIAEPLEFIATGISLQNVSCFNGNDGQAGVNLTNGTADTYVWSTNQSTSEIADLSVGFYDVTITNTDNCEAYTSVEITQPAAPLTLMIDVLAEVSCFGETDAVLQATAFGPTEQLTYNWATGGTTAINENLAAGTYILTVTNANNCEAEAMVTLTQPDELIAEISATAITCLDPINGGVITIDTVYGGISGYDFSTDGEAFSSFAVLDGLEAGAYDVVVRDNKGCEEIQTITVNGPPELLVDLGPDDEIQLGETIDLEVIANSEDLNYTWTPVDTLNSGEIQVSPLVSTLYTVSVFDTITKCSTEGSIFIWVNKARNVFIPNAFSPNGDGNNDVFQIFGGVGIKEVKSLRIFSRFGNLLHEKDKFQLFDINAVWDGKFNGRPMNTGVYVYSIEIEFIDGITEVFHGDVVLLR